MSKPTLKEILLKYQAGDCTEDEKAIVETFYLQLTEDDEQTLSDAQLIAAVERVGARLPVQQRTRLVKLWPRIAAAIALLMTIGITGYLVFKPKSQNSQIAQTQNTIVPGRNQATLTLANGQKIILTKGMSGQLAQQAGVSIGLNHLDAITYSTASSPTDTSTVYNTLATGVGEQSPYPLELSDGTKVWLNASSSIKFPVSFAGKKQRNVTLTGEAYFSVTHNENIPFKVITHNLITEDIGTDFNIEAYDDIDAAKTTLILGAIKVIAGSRTILLKPGQQAITDKGGLQIDDVNIEDVIAWKNGYFQFEDETLENIMRSISRWYNVQIIFTDNRLKTARYGFVSTRFANISMLLKQIEDSGNVRFKLDGSTILVSRKYK